MPHRFLAAAALLLTSPALALDGRRVSMTLDRRTEGLTVRLVAAE